MSVTTRAGIRAIVVWFFGGVALTLAGITLRALGYAAGLPFMALTEYYRWLFFALVIGTAGYWGFWSAVRKYHDANSRNVATILVIGIGVLALIANLTGSLLIRTEQIDSWALVVVQQLPVLFFVLLSIMGVGLAFWIDQRRRITTLRDSNSLAARGGSPSGGVRLLKGVFAALGWALLFGCFVFFFLFLSPLLFGGPGAHQAPFLAFLIGPRAFLLAIPIMLALTFLWPRLRYVLVLATAAIPIWYYASMPKVDPREHLLPLSAQERQLRNTAHFAVSVAVENPGFPPVYTNSLISDLRETGLFDRVGALGEVTSPDLVARLEDRYYGDREGQSFTLRLARRPDRDEHVKVVYVLGGLLSAAGERQRYRDRLAVETIRKVQALAAAPQ